jgi:predicted GIY-YIG superfamily endonuclease
MEARFLYYARFNDGTHSVYKIGISSNVVTRVIKATRKGYTCLLLMVEAFDSEKDARQAENIVKKAFAEYRVYTYWSGQTETFSKDVLGIDKCTS